MLRCWAAVWRCPAGSYTPKGSPGRRGVRSIAVCTKGINLELAKGVRGVGVESSSCTQEHGWALRSRPHRWQQDRIYPQLPRQEIFFAPVCAGTAARQIFPYFGSPTKQSFAQRCCCTPWEEVLGSLSRFLRAAAAAAGVTSHAGPLGTPTCHHTGVFLYQTGLIHTSQPGLAEQRWYTLGPVVPTQLPSVS